MTVRFIHTADWQLGMTRHFLAGEAQARFAQARLDAIARIGALAREHRAEFVIVAGDVFETNQVGRQTISRACEALRTIEVPVFLLPGNHEQLDATSVFRQPTFVRSAPATVVVIGSTEPLRVEGRPGIEIVGAPRLTKRTLGDPLEPGYADLAPVPGVTRVLVGHGIVDAVMPIGDAPDEETRIRVDPLRAAIADGRVAYVALGDRHSTTRVDPAGRIWYAGAPEPTAYVETDAGNILLVEIDEGGAGTPAAADAPCTVTPLPVGTWRFVLDEHRLDGPADVDALARWFDGLPSKERTVVKVTLRGTLALRDKARLDALLDEERDRFAAIEEWERHADLAVVPDDADFADLDLGGYAAEAVADLRRKAAGTGDEARTAADALALLVRLAGPRA
ncbi:MAG: metallophosphoesterase [Chloroflexi bacterium]|nr:metallophosphoesterase [Chloroflexota bacterium]